MPLFGTNGIRGVANEEITPEFAVKIAKAIGSYFEGDIAIAMDTRISSEMIKNSVISGLVSVGCNVYDANIAPTPALQYYLKNSDFDAGVIITASHNPPQYNGIKVVDNRGEELQREVEEEIEKISHSEKFRKKPWNEIGSIYNLDIIDFYIEGVLKNAEAEETKLKVVIDCGNGAGCLAMPYIVASVADAITLNSEPRGLPVRNYEPVKENVSDLIRAVKAVDADLGIAYDGDADRAIFIAENGEYIGGDYSLAIFAGYKLEKKKGKIVVPVSTSRCVEEYVKMKGGSVFYTKVGARNVAKKMKEINAIFGGEENGGMIFPEHQYCRDGGMASVFMIKLMAEKGEKLSDMVKNLPKYFIVKEKVECREKEKVIEKIKENVSGNVDFTDGIKIIGKDYSILIRPSGTEPIIRIYVESKSEEEAKRIAEEYKKSIKELSK
ncbi:MAG: phosphoglucosamine mutase [Thermoplasmatales archaeon]|nr:phosphoglucosamine mutase [Thermoplasmatales archaeon]